MIITLALVVAAVEVSTGESAPLVPEWSLVGIASALVVAVVVLARQIHKGQREQIEQLRARAERAEAKLEARDEQLAEVILPALSASAEAHRASAAALSGMAREMAEATRTGELVLAELRGRAGRAARG